MHFVDFLRATVLLSAAAATALVIVTVPKPPGSSVSISPLAAVLEIAPAKVLQGAVREHGLTSSPTPETQVRIACACAPVDTTNRAAQINDRANPVFLIGWSFRDKEVGGNIETGLKP